MCQQDLTKVICVGCIFSVESCIKTHYFSAKVKGNLKLKEIYLYHVFLISQYFNMNSDDHYASVLKLIFLKHNIECLSQVTVYGGKCICDVHFIV